MHSNPISTGLLAYGLSGQAFHAPFIEAHRGFALDAITERNKKLAGVRYPNIRSYDDTDSLLNDHKLELVIINTPNNTHSSYAQQALLAGKHILIEKPCASSLAETTALFELAEKCGRKVMVYQNRRWDSDFQQVKTVIESGQLGRLTEVRFNFDRYRLNIGPKVFKESPIPGSGIVYDLMPHILDQAISLFGKPEHCTKTTGCFRPGSQVTDYAEFQLSYADGFFVYLHVSMLVPHALPSYVVHGTQGTLIKKRADVQEEQLVAGISPLEPIYGQEHAHHDALLFTYQADGSIKETTLPSMRGNYLGLFDAVYDEIRGNKPFPITKEHICWQMALLEA